MDHTHPCMHNITLINYHLARYLHIITININEQQTLNFVPVGYRRTQQTQSLHYRQLLAVRGQSSPQSDLL